MRACLEQFEGCSVDVDQRLLRLQAISFPQGARIVPRQVRFSSSTSIMDLSAMEALQGCARDVSRPRISGALQPRWKRPPALATSVSVGNVPKLRQRHHNTTLSHIMHIAGTALACPLDVGCQISVNLGCNGLCSSRPPLSCFVARLCRAKLMEETRHLCAVGPSCFVTPPQFSVRA